jgi:hypothetical protein
MVKRKQKHGTLIEVSFIKWQREIKIEYDAADPDAQRFILKVKRLRKKYPGKSSMKSKKFLKEFACIVEEFTAKTVAEYLRRISREGP